MSIDDFQLSQTAKSIIADPTNTICGRCNLVRRLQFKRLYLLQLNYKMLRTLTRWTLEDYHRLSDCGLLAGRQVELLDGQIIDMAPEKPIHRATYRRGVQYLERLLGDRSVVFATAPITLSENSEPQPDICLAVPPESRYDDHHPQGAEIYWLIEVSNSTLAYDLTEKAQLYARNGIKEYWVVDIPGNQLWIHREPRDGKYQSVVRCSSGLVTPLAFPSVSVEVNRLLP